MAGALFTSRPARHREPDDDPLPDEPVLLPIPVEPGDELLDPVEDGELDDPVPVDDGELEPVVLLDPEVLEPLLDPFDMMSRVCTCGVSPGPEKLART